MTLSRVAHALIVLIAVVLILTYTKDILLPFVLAVIIWYLIRQVQVFVRRIHIGGRELPQWVRGTVSFLAIFLVLGVVTSLLATNIAGITEVLPLYEENLLLVKQRIEAGTNVDIMGYLDRTSNGFDIGAIITRLLNSLTTLFGNAFLVVIYVAFLMLEERHAKEKFEAWHFGSGERERTADILDQVDRALSKYLTLKTAVSLITGVLSYIALLIIGVDFAFFWAFVIFLLNYIPTIGSLVATVFPALIAALQFASFGPAFWVLGVVGTIQMLVGNFLEPRLMGNSLNVSSLVVILSLAFWGSLWGVVGMILSVPITVMMVIVLAQFPTTRWLAVLLSDKGQVGTADE
ncbi:MAG: AI-2E family transporter [Flavobacteriales bacterium]|nr:AI-2E family transporter [Flavobacteriales bacterium]